MFNIQNSISVTQNINRPKKCHMIILTDEKIYQNSTPGHEHLNPTDNIRLNGTTVNAFPLKFITEEECPLSDYSCST